MHDRSSRTGMRELTVRAMLHGAALGDDGDAGMAAILASEIDNPLLSEQADQARTGLGQGQPASDSMTQRGGRGPLRHCTRRTPGPAGEPVSRARTEPTGYSWSGGRAAYDHVEPGARCPATRPDTGSTLAPFRGVQPPGNVMTPRTNAGGLAQLK